MAIRANLPSNTLPKVGSPTSVPHGTLRGFNRYVISYYTKSHGHDLRDR